jgi:gliding motility-associated protein GldM
MALPKEPRQKMINIMYLVLTALLALNVSSEILNAFRVVNGSLKRSNDNLAATSDDIYASFEKAKQDSKTREKANQFGPLADQVKAETATLAKLVEDYRKKIEEGAGGYGPDGKLKKEDGLDVGSRVMLTDKGGDQLFAAIQNYQAKVKSIMGTEYSFAFPKGTPLQDSSIKDGKDLAIKNFNMQPAVANLTMLSKTMNDLKNTEGTAVKHLFSKIDGIVIRLNKFEPLVSTNATYLMPGEELVVSAGVGAFNDDAKPQISIGGSGVTTGPNGMGERKFVVGTTGGTVPVVINFKDPNTGETKTISKSITYTVGTPGGASVSADKMNVLYIGVANPVTVASGKGWDKTTVSMSGGSLSGSNGKYTATVSSEGTANIIVNMGDKTATFPFRVKTLPPPTVYCGQSRGEDMQSASLKAMQGLRAQLENSEFDAPYRVVSYTITGSGAGFKDGAVSAANQGNFWGGTAGTIANRAVPGSIISFSNILIVGPDGKTRKPVNPSFSIRCL